MQKSVCRESACMAPLPIPVATRRFALASIGITITETAATMMGMLRPYTDLFRDRRLTPFRTAVLGNISLNDATR